MCPFAGNLVVLKVRHHSLRVQCETFAFQIQAFSSFRTLLSRTTRRGTFQDTITPFYTINLGWEVFLQLFRDRAGAVNFTLKNKYCLLLLKNSHQTADIIDDKEPLATSGVTYFFQFHQFVMKYFIWQASTTALQGYKDVYLSHTCASISVSCIQAQQKSEKMLTCSEKKTDTMLIFNQQCYDASN